MNRLIRTCQDRFGLGCSFAPWVLALGLLTAACGGAQAVAGEGGVTASHRDLAIAVAEDFRAETDLFPRPSRTEAACVGDSFVAVIGPVRLDELDVTAELVAQFGLNAIVPLELQRDEAVALELFEAISECVDLAGRLADGLADVGITDDAADCWAGTILNDHAVQVATGRFWDMPIDVRPEFIAAAFRGAADCFDERDFSVIGRI